MRAVKRATDYVLSEPAQAYDEYIAIKTHHGHSRQPKDFRTIFCLLQSRPEERSS